MADDVSMETHESDETLEALTDAVVEQGKALNLAADAMRKQNERLESLEAALRTLHGMHEQELGKLAGQVADLVLEVRGLGGSGVRKIQRRD